jgi:hypothetical protein
MLRPWRARGHSGGAFVSCRKAETEEEKVKCKASKRASEGITFSGEWFAGYHAERQTRRGLRRLGARCRQVQRRLVRRFRGWRDSTRGRRKQARTLASHWRHISLAVWRVSFARASWSISLFSDLLLAEVDIAIPTSCAIRSQHRRACVLPDALVFAPRSVQLRTYRGAAGCAVAVVGSCAMNPN